LRNLAGGALLELFIHQPTYVVSFTRILNEIDLDLGNSVVDTDDNFGRKKINFYDVVRLILTVRGNGSSLVTSFRTDPHRALWPREMIGPGETANTVDGVCEARDPT
jgi:hypothetical protein